MSPFSELLGPTLLTKEGEKPTDDCVSGKTAVGLYFSAHWCPPCRGFTPKLGEAYTNHLKAKGLEVVFVSSDRDEEAFNDYYGEQPWLSLPYSARDLKATLSKKYKVQGIPTFVILDGATGELITKDGREKASTDPKGADFPWKPPTIWEALGDEFLVGVEGETKEISEVRAEAKVIGLYFSAHWCPPCRGFTPDLVKAYKDHLKAKGLEIIFVSSDRDAAAFQEYFGEMPWLAIPNGDKRKQQLSSMFEVEGIPSFVLIDAKTGETINAAARGKVSQDPEGKEFPWIPKPLKNLSEGDGVEDINETPALCVLVEGCDAGVKEAAKAVLDPIANAFKASGDETMIMYAPTGEGPVGQIRKLTKLGDASGTPQMVLLDIPDNGGYYVSPANEITEETVSSFLEMYKAKALDRQQLG